MNSARILPFLLAFAMASAHAADPGASATASATAKASAPASADAPANPSTTANTDTGAATAATADAAAQPHSAAGSGTHAGEAGSQADGSKRDGHGAATAADSIQLGTTEISGNRELPKLLYIVPWQRAQVGKFSGRPPNSLVDETLTPVDRSVFERQNRYYSALESSTQSAASQSATSQAGVAPAAAAAGAPRDEK